MFGSWRIRSKGHLIEVPYTVKRNVERETRQTRAPEAARWTTPRFLETDVLARTEEIADEVIAALRSE